MSYYSKTTTSENRINHPTPYLCLKSRLVQSFLNKNILLCAFLFLLIEFFHKLVLYSNSSGIGGSLSQVGNPKSQNELSLILDVNIVDLINFEKQTIVDSIASHYDITKDICLSYLNSSLKEQHFYINSSISDSLALVEDTTSSIETAYQKILENLNTTIISSLVAENDNLLNLKSEITNSAIYVGQSLDLSNLKINITDIESILSAFLSSSVNEDIDSDLVALNASKDSTLGHLKEIYSYSLPLIDETFTRLSENIRNVSNFSISFVLNYTDIPLTMTKMSNMSFENLTTVNYTAIDLKWNDYNARYFGHRVCLFILMGTIFIIDLIWQWVKFRFEQDAVKSIINDTEFPKDNLSPVFYVSNAKSYFITHWILKFVNFLHINVLRNIHPWNNTVLMYWFVNFTFSNEAKLFDLGQFIFFYSLFYGLFTEISTYPESEAQTELYTEISNSSYSSIITSQPTYLIDSVRSYNDELNHLILEIIDTAANDFKSQVTNLTTSVQNLFELNFSNQTVLPDIGSFVSVFASNSSNAMLYLNQFKDAFSNITLSMSELEISKMQSNLTTISKSTYMSSSNRSTRVDHQLARDMSGFRIFGFSLVVTLMVYEMSAFTYICFRNFKLTKNSN